MFDPLHVVLISLMVLPLNLFAKKFQSESEVSVPYVKKDVGYIDSAVLSSDGNSFYTLKEGLVSHWQLNPIKKLSSFKTNIIYKDKPVGYKIDISNDNQKIILYSLYEIQLWDIKSKKHLKTVKEELSLATNSKYGFLTLTHNDELHIWNDTDLTLLKTTKIEHNYKVEGDRYSYNMINGDNILFINYPIDGLFFDLDTLKIIEVISNITDEGNRVRNEGNHAISKYRQSYMNKYANKFTPYLWKVYMRFIWDRRYFSKMSSFISTSRNDATIENELLLGTFGRGFQYTFTKIVFNQKRKRYYFYQFKDGWLLIDTRRDFFTGSKNIKKYLMMELKSGAVIPINDITFQKYNKQIKLKD